MVNIRCSASDRLRVPARPAQHLDRRVPHLQRRTRRNASIIGGNTRELAIGRAAADQAGACPYLHRCISVPPRRQQPRQPAIVTVPDLVRFIEVV
jgi:hypothetical protein